MNHLMPIIESVRAQQTTPVAYPLKVNTARAHVPTHVCNASQHHWVMSGSLNLIFEDFVGQFDGYCVGLFRFASEVSRACRWAAPRAQPDGLRFQQGLRIR